MMGLFFEEFEAGVSWPLGEHCFTREAMLRYGPSVLNQPFFVILNLAVGGHFDGDPGSDAIFPATMFVDYVRVYRRATAMTGVLPARPGLAMLPP